MRKRETILSLQCDWNGICDWWKVSEEGKREIAIWFTEAEMTKYRLVSEEILYDVNLDGILE